MNTTAKVGRIQSAVTLLTEVVEDLQKAGEDDMAAAAQRVQHDAKRLLLELRPPEKRP